jgi:hypothetical protein
LQKTNYVRLLNTTYNHCPRVFFVNCFRSLPILLTSFDLKTFRHDLKFVDFFPHKRSLAHKKTSLTGDKKSKNHGIFFFSSCIQAGNTAHTIFFWVFFVKVFWVGGTTTRTRRTRRTTRTTT